MSDIISKLKELEECDCSGQHLLQWVQNHRSGAAVKRYHTVNMLVEETVGHHSANVAILCILLSEQKPSVNLLMAALLHDMAEQYTGDIPATAKWASDELKAALDKMEYEAHTESVMAVPGLDAEERLILKQADMLDLCFKCMEEITMGNRGAMPMLRRGLAYLQNNHPLHMTNKLIEEIRYELSQF